MEVTGYKEENNILNPLSGDVSYQLLDTIKSNKQTEAIKEKGLYELAETHAKEILTDKLGAFSEYRIVFL